MIDMVGIPAVPEKSERKMALVVVDMQNKFLVGSSESAIESVKKRIPVISEAVDRFNEAGRPVFFISYDGLTHFMEDNTDDGDAIISGINVSPKNTVIHKYHMNSFKNTCLGDAVLFSGCDTVLLAGMYLEFCVVSTYYGAANFQIKPFVLKDALVPLKEESVEKYLAVLDTMTMDDVKENLANPVAKPTVRLQTGC